MTQKVDERNISLTSDDYIIEAWLRGRLDKKAYAEINMLEGSDIQYPKVVDDLYETYKRAFLNSITGSKSLALILLYGKVYQFFWQIKGRNPESIELPSYMRNARISSVTITPVSLIWEHKLYTGNYDGTRFLTYVADNKLVVTPISNKTPECRSYEIDIVYRTRSDFKDEVFYIMDAIDLYRKDEIKAAILLLHVAYELILRKIIFDFKDDNRVNSLPSVKKCLMNINQSKVSSLAEAFLDIEKENIGDSLPSVLKTYLKLLNEYRISIEHIRILGNSNKRNFIDKVEDLIISMLFFYKYYSLNVYKTKTSEILSNKEQEILNPDEYNGVAFKPVNIHIPPENL